MNNVVSVGHRRLALGLVIGLLICAVAYAQFGPPPATISGQIPTTVTINTINSTTNIVINTNAYFTQNVNITSNLTVNQNISVSGKATFNNITVTNQLQFSTNAFPLSAGTTWNLTKNYQRIITNNDFSITAISGLTNYAINWGTILWSNSDSATHFCDLSTLPVTLFGQNSTNKVYTAAGKQAVISVSIYGNVGDSTNLVTAGGQ